MWSEGQKRARTATQITVSRATGKSFGHSKKILDGYIVGGDQKYVEEKAHSAWRVKGTVDTLCAAKGHTAKLWTEWVLVKQ